MPTVALDPLAIEPKLNEQAPAVRVAAEQSVGADGAQVGGLAKLSTPELQLAVALPVYPATPFVTVDEAPFATASKLNEQAPDHNTCAGQSACATGAHELPVRDSDPLEQLAVAVPL